MSLSIRQADLADASRLAQLNSAVQQVHHEAQPMRYKPADPHDPALIAWFEQQLARSDCTIFIAEVEAEPVGYVVCVILDQPETPFVYALKRLQIDQLSVNESQRRSGVGTALLERAYKLAHSLGIEKIRLGVMAFNEGAVAFYQRHQFTVDSLTMVFDLDGES